VSHVMPATARALATPEGVPAKATLDMVSVLLKVTAAVHRTTTRRAPLVICHFTPPTVSPAMIRRWKINTTIPSGRE
jgi:hypothetical protein